jgi:hypothetical protein
MRALSSVPLVELEEGIGQPAHHSEPIRGLQIHDAYKCSHCDFITKSVELRERHLRKSHLEFTHSSLDSGIHSRWRSVKVQQWMPKGKGSHYWIVNSGVDPGAVQERDDDDAGEGADGVDGNLSWEDRAERLEKARLRKQKRERTMMTAKNNADDTTPWLLRTKWPQTFANKSLRLIGRTRYSDLDAQTQMMFPDWTDRRTRLIGFEFDKVMARAQTTLVRTSDSLCCWLQSSRRNQPSHRPFRRLQMRSTDKRYSMTWKQFLYYCLRIFRLNSEKREEQYGIVFTREQLRCLAEVDELLDEALQEKADEELEEDGDYEMDGDDLPWLYEEEEEEEEEDECERAENRNEYSPPQCHRLTGTRTNHQTTPVCLADRLTEKLFELCIKFLTHTFRGGEDESRTPLVHFCGVLGINWKEERFRDPGNYTPLLAGIMWVSRLLLLEYALPSERYSTLDWPSREYYGDHQWRLESVRRDFMLEGCLTPLGYMVGLMAYGKFTTRQLGRCGVITWDEDGEGLQIKDIRVTMAGFKSFVAGVISNAQEIMNKELLFSVGQMNLDLLNIRDIMMEKKNGFSMLEIENNRLGGGLRYMLNLVKSASPERSLLNGQEEWRRDRIVRYLEWEKR